MKNCGLILVGKKFTIGMFFAPVLLVVVWCFPNDLQEVIQPGYLVVLILNIFAAYIDFLFHFYLSHLIATKIAVCKLWAYCLVILLLSIAVFIGLNTFHLHGINGLGYGKIEVLKDGHITDSGYLFLLRNCAFNAFAHIGSMCILWRVAFRYPPGTRTGSGRAN